MAIAIALYDFNLLLLMQIEFTYANLRIFGKKVDAPGQIIINSIM
jgi:hypothetical protein